MRPPIPDQDEFDPAVTEVLARLREIDAGQLIFLRERIQDQVIEDATAGQIRTLLFPLEQALARLEERESRGMGSALDRRPAQREMVISKAVRLMKDESKELTHADRSLIAGYLETMHERQKEFTARMVNDRLELLGVERIGNITAALSALETQKFLEVVEKAGEQPQGQKKHRLTPEGYEQAAILLSLADSG